MDENNAKLIFLAIMGFGFAIWLISLLNALRLGRETQPSVSETFDDPQMGDIDSDSGTLTLRGEPEDLSTLFVQALSTGQGLFVSLFAIKRFDGGRVAMKKTGPILCNQSLGLNFNEAEFAFEKADHETTEVSYRLGYSRQTRLTRKVVLGICLGIGLPLMLVVAALIWNLVIPNNNPAVRWQVFQTLQIAHALWPPYMFLGIYSRGRRQSKTLMENILRSLDLAV